MAVVFMLLAYFYWFFLFNAAWEKRGALQTKLSDLEQQVAAKERIVAQKDKYLKEIVRLKEEFSIALTKLPDKREVPGLFQSVSLAGKAAGIDFLLFEPKAPEKPPDKPPDKGAEVRANLKPSDQRAEQKPGEPAKPGAKPPAASDKFYEEIPVKVNIAGGFNNIVYFFDKVAKLPRIVNIEEITFVDAKGISGGRMIVNTNCTVKTYMFTEKTEKMDKKGGKPDEKKK